MLKKFLKISLLVVVVLGVVVLVAPAFLPRTYEITRSLDIQAPAPAIYPFLGDFQAFNRWQPWIRMEPDAKQVVTGKPFESGHLYRWEGEKIGKGSMLLSAARSNESVTVQLDFGMGEVATNTLSLRESAGITRVTWHIAGNIGYFGRPFGLMMDRMLGGDFESGLANLKAEVEKGRP